LSAPIARIALLVAASICLPGETAAEAQDAPPEVATPLQIDPSPIPPPISAPPPPATPPPRNPRFGDPGQVVLDGALSASLGHTSYSAIPTSATSVSVAPAFDYFSTPNLSGGVSAFLGYSDTTFAPSSESKTWTYGASAQLGINLWLGERVSFWPKLGAGGSRSTTTWSVSGALSPGNTTTKVVFVRLDAPFLFHVADHFFVGFGPTVLVDLLGNTGPETNLRRSYGAASTIGGWF
jgi:hypothetical protein